MNSKSAVFLDTALWPGHLGLILAGPDPDAALQTLRRESGLDTLVVLDPSPDQAAPHPYVRSAQDQYLNVLVQVVTADAPPSDDAEFDALLDEIMTSLLGGETVALLGSEGHSGLLAACLLVRAGLSPADALRRLEALPEKRVLTPSQTRYLRAYDER